MMNMFEAKKSAKGMGKKTAPNGGAGVSTTKVPSSSKGTKITPKSGGPNKVTKGLNGPSVKGPAANSQKMATKKK